MVCSNTSFMNTFFIFQNSMKDNFNISDVIVRILAIENFYGKNDFGFQWYNLMQRTRVAHNPKIPKDRANNQERFIKLIESFEQKGYDNNFPIELNKKMELLDGSHRFALSVYHHILSIPYFMPPEKSEVHVDYSLQWLIEHGLSFFVPTIKKKYSEIIFDYTNKLEHCEVCP